MRSRGICLASSLAVIMSSYLSFRASACLKPKLEAKREIHLSIRLCSTPLSSSGLVVVSVAFVRLANGELGAGASATTRFTSGTGLASMGRSAVPTTIAAPEIIMAVLSPYCSPARLADAVRRLGERVHLFGMPHVRHAQEATA